LKPAAAEVMQAGDFNRPAIIQDNKD